MKLFKTVSDLNITIFKKEEELGRLLGKVRIMNLDMWSDKTTADYKKYESAIYARIDILTKELEKMYRTRDKKLNKFAIAVL